MLGLRPSHSLLTCSVHAPDVADSKHQQSDGELNAHDEQVDPFFLDDAAWHGVLRAKDQPALGATASSRTLVSTVAQSSHTRRTEWPKRRRGLAVIEHKDAEVKLAVLDPVVASRPLAESCPFFSFLEHVDSLRAGQACRNNSTLLTIFAIKERFPHADRSKIFRSIPYPWLPGPSPGQLSPLESDIYSSDCSSRRAT